MSKERSPAALFSRTMGTRPERFLFTAGVDAKTFFEMFLEKPWNRRHANRDAIMMKCDE